MMVRQTVIALATLACLAGPAAAEEAARIDEAISRIEDFGPDLRIELVLSRAVPWRVETLEGPHRLVVEFQGVETAGVNLAGIVQSDWVERILAEPGEESDWVRVVLILTQPLRVETAGLSDGTAGVALKLQLTPTTPEEFSRALGPLTETAIPGRAAEVVSAIAP